MIAPPTRPLGAPAVMISALDRLPKSKITSAAACTAREPEDDEDLLP